MSSTPLAYGDDVERNWSSPLIPCTQDLLVCFFGALCPCALAASLWTKFQRQSDSHCPVNCLLFCVAPCMLCYARGKYRAKLSIAGSTGSDCMTVLCCPLCAICQEVREYDRYQAMVFMDEELTDDQVYRKFNAPGTVSATR